MDKAIQTSWLSFIEEAQTNIFPIYQEHEEHFDGAGIHGRMHISRALVFAEVMGRLYLHCDQHLDVYAVLLAVAFHDSGRQGNGADLWEGASAGLCYKYLLQKSNEKYATFVSNLIDKSGASWDIHKRIMHDADVLEIMRPCCGHGGIDGFRQKMFRFAGDRDPLMNLFEDPSALRKQFIQQAWELIQITEEIKPQLVNSKQYLMDVLGILERNLSLCSLFSNVVA